MIDYTIHSFTEGIRELGIRFVIAGSVSISIGYVYRYHKLLIYILKQIKDKASNNDKYREWK